MTTVRKMENAIMDRVILVNNKAKGPVANVGSPYNVIDWSRNDEFCEHGLCQYIYVVRRDNMENVRWLKYNLDRLRLEKLFDLDFYDEFVEFFNSCYNDVMRRMQFIGYTPEEVIAEDFTEHISELAAKGLLRIYSNKEYLVITPLSTIAIVEEDGTVGVYCCI